jgi:hypothetical protein
MGEGSMAARFVHGADLNRLARIDGDNGFVIERLDHDGLSTLDDWVDAWYALGPFQEARCTDCYS